MDHEFSMPTLPTPSATSSWTVIGTLFEASASRPRGSPGLPGMAKVAQRRTMKDYSQSREWSNLMLGLGPKRRDFLQVFAFDGSDLGNLFGTTPIPSELLS